MRQTDEDRAPGLSFGETRGGSETRASMTTTAIKHVSQNSFQNANATGGSTLGGGVNKLGATLPLPGKVKLLSMEARTLSFVPAPAPARPALVLGSGCGVSETSGQVAAAAPFSSLVYLHLHLLLQARRMPRRTRLRSTTGRFPGTPCPRERGKPATR